MSDHLDTARCGCGTECLVFISPPDGRPAIDCDKCGKRTRLPLSAMPLTARPEPELPATQEQVTKLVSMLRMGRAWIPEADLLQVCPRSAIDVLYWAGVLRCRTYECVQYQWAAEDVPAKSKSFSETLGL